MTNEPNLHQMAGFAQLRLKSEVESRNQNEWALDNVDGFYERSQSRGGRNLGRLRVVLAVRQPWGDLRSRTGRGQRPAPNRRVVVEDTGWSNASTGGDRTDRTDQGSTSEAGRSRFLAWHENCANEPRPTSLTMAPRRTRARITSKTARTNPSGTCGRRGQPNQGSERRIFTKVSHGFSFILIA
jgi:hypothetical protein